MKKKYMLISTAILISLLVGGGTMAWFSYSGSATNEFTMGTVQVEVLKSGLEDITGAEEEKEYQQSVVVKSLGNKKAYIRVRFIPQWSNPSLPVSNVELILGGNTNWVKVESDDGYDYYSYYLTENEKTQPLPVSVKFTKLGPEYKDQTFTLKVAAEGIQTTNRAWRTLWGLDKLPFTPNQRCNP